MKYRNSVSESIHGIASALHDAGVIDGAEMAHFDKSHPKRQQSMLDALAALPDLAAELADIELEIPPRSTAQRRPVELD